MNKSPNIIWSYTGKPDLVAGTEATAIEKLFAWTGGLIGIGITLFFYWKNEFNWTNWQYIVVAVIAYDTVGGAIANSLNSCKRFYHSSLQTFESGYVKLAKNNFFFVLIHIHTLLISFTFSAASLFYGIFWYLLLQASVLTVTKTPLYLQRPVSIVIIVTILLINSYIVISPVGFEWLVPILFIKIVYGHTVKEEPYRPEIKNTI